MQNQRAVLAHERVYANSFDCFFKVIRNEGPQGLYRGECGFRRAVALTLDIEVCSFFTAIVKRLKRRDFEP